MMRVRDVLGTHMQAGHEPDGTSGTCVSRKCRCRDHLSYRHHGCKPAHESTLGEKCCTCISTEAQRVPVFNKAGGLSLKPGTCFLTCMCTYPTQPHIHPHPHPHTDATQQTSPTHRSRQQAAHDLEPVGLPRLGRQGKAGGVGADVCHVSTEDTQGLVWVQLLDGVQFKDSIPILQVTDDGRQGVCGDDTHLCVGSRARDRDKA